MRLVVLTYHRVAPGRPVSPEDLTVSPEEFASQIERVRRAGLTPVRQREVALWLAGAGSMPERPVVISFDDGYADNMVHAYPVLERMGVPAISFVVTQRLGGMNDWDDGKLPPWQLMSAGDVAAWSRRGLEFGAHGRTHRSLVGAEEPLLGSEVDGSAADLEAITGEKTVAFAYPYGELDERARRRASSCYTLAYCGHEGANGQDAGAWELKRTTVSPAYSRFEFWSQLRFGWNPAAKARHALDRLRRPAAPVGAGSARAAQ